MKNISNLSLCLSSLICFACSEASETEKQARRENAFDLAGSYAGTTTIGSEIEFSIQIENLASRSAVKATLNRNPLLTEAERQTLSKLGISPNEAEGLLPAQLVFIEATDAQDHGGSNVSDDFGKTSKIRLQTKDFLIGKNRKFYFYLTGTFLREDMSFKGELELRASLEEPGTGSDGKATTNYSSESSITKLVGKSNLIFSNQYYGLWRGKTELDPGQDAVLKTLPEFTLQKNKDETFSLIPKVLDFQFKNEKFSYNSETFKTDILRSGTAPFIEIRWTGDRGNKIHLVASLWSLGQCDGNLLLEPSVGELVIIGGFQLSRQ